MEITVFSKGDSRSQKTWSGVPFYLTKALERQNVKINRVDISIKRPLSSIVKRYNRILRIIYKTKRGGG